LAVIDAVQKEPSTALLGGEGVKKKERNRQMRVARCGWPVCRIMYHQTRCCDACLRSCEAAIAHGTQHDARCAGSRGGLLDTGQPARHPFQVTGGGLLVMHPSQSSAVFGCLAPGYTRRLGGQHAGAGGSRGPRCSGGSPIAQLSPRSASESITG